MSPCNLLFTICTYNHSFLPLSAFSTRLFSVLRFESVIHEFDPYFNYRTTRFLTEEGFYNFHNWFDDRAWYPLGRIIGGTIYPGLMVTSAALYRILWLINFTVDIRNVCVFLAPFFSSLTTIVTYLLTKEIHVSTFVCISIYTYCDQNWAIKCTIREQNCLITNKFPFRALELD